MMGFGGSSLSYGATSSSTLSPTAPPFTVDRTAPRPTLPPHSPPPVRDPYDYYAPAASAPPDCWPHLYPSGSSPPPPLAPPYDAFPQFNSAADLVCFGRGSAMGPDLSPAGTENYGTTLSSPLPSSLIQAEPYYPHYSSTAAAAAGGGVLVSGGDRFEGSLADLGYTRRCVSPWNRPFDGETTRAGAVRGSSSLMEPKDKVVTSRYKVFSQPDGPTPEAFVAYEDGLGCWSGKYTESVARKVQLGSECSTWLSDKPPALLEENFRAPFNTSETSATALNALIEGIVYPHSSDHVAFMDAGNTFNSNPSCNKNVSQLAHDSAPSACRTTILMDKNMQKNGSPCVKDVDPYKSNERYMGPISVKIKEPIISLNTEGRAGYLEKRRMIIKKGDNPFVNSSVVRITSPSYLEPTTANAKSQSSGSISDSKFANLKLPSACAFAPSSGESCDPKQSSSETLDQLNLSVDSPCWKGASYSQRSPFSAVETVVMSSYVTNQKFVDADKEGSDCSKLENWKRPQCASGPEEERNEAMLSKNSKSSSKSKDNDVMLSRRDENSGTSALQPVLVPRTANLEASAKSPAQGCSSSFCAVARDQASNSSSSVSAVSDEIVNPLGTSDPSSKCLPVGIDIQLVAKMMYNLSELLLSSCNVDQNVLKEHGHELLQLAIDNLRMYLLKNVGSRGMKQQPVTHSCSSHLNRNLFASSEGTSKGKLQVTGLEAVDDATNWGDWKNTNSGEAKMHSICSYMEFDKVHNFVSTSDDFNFRSKVMTQLQEKIMKENLHEQGENPQTLLFKNLWIEAEAALCSLKYELQLARSKIVMEKCPQQLTEEFHGSVDADGKPSNVLESSISNTTNDLDGDNLSLPKAGESLSQITSAVGNTSAIGKVESQSSFLNCQETIPSSITNKTEEMESSVMARLKVLKGRIDIDGDSLSLPKAGESLSEITSALGEAIQSSMNNTTEEFDTSFMARLKVLRGEIDKADSTRVDEQQRLPDSIDVGITVGAQETTCCPCHADTDCNAEVNLQDTIVDPTSVERRNPWLFRGHKTGVGTVDVSTGRPGDELYNEDIGLVSDGSGELQERLIDPTFTEWRNPWLFHGHETSLDSDVSGELQGTLDDPAYMEWRNPWFFHGHGLGGGGAEVSSRSGDAACYEDIGLNSGVSGEQEMASEFHACSGVGRVFQSNIPNNRPGRQLRAAGHDSSSSDWEHVLKEELTW